MNAGSQPKILVIIGPTCAGKSALALEVAKRLEAEIISADSMQVYRGMDIGTAKPTPEERAAVAHHLIDILDPNESYNAGRFEREASEIIHALRQRGAPAIVAGGTGLYVKALIHGLFEAPPVDPDLRASLLDEASRIGPAEFHESLRRVDPVAAARLHPHDTVRIARALEIYRLAGRPMTDLQARHRFEKRLFLPLILGLSMEREILYDRIERRVDRMISAGWVEEVRGLLDRGYDEESPGLRGLGYGRILDHLRGRYTVEEAVEEIKKETRRYAKRQMTWFRSMPEIDWQGTPIDADAAAALYLSFLESHLENQDHVDF